MENLHTKGLRVKIFEGPVDNVYEKITTWIKISENHIYKILQSSHKDGILITIFYKSTEF